MLERLDDSREEGWRGFDRRRKRRVRGWAVKVGAKSNREMGEKEMPVSY